MSLPTTAQPDNKRRRWQIWLVGAAVIITVVVVALGRPDTWLRRTLEQQVSQASAGYYSLRSCTPAYGAAP